MANRISMKDIAEELGVSVALVSYVLNGKFTNRIHVDTAEKIRELAAKYQYTPNQIAKSLKSNKTYTIGLIVADISNLFYSEIAHHIEGEVNKYGYNVLFGSAYEDSERFKNILDVFMSKQVDGLILAVPEGAEKYLERVANSKFPYVVLDRQFDVVPDHKIINIDNYAASRSVVLHFHQEGFTRVGAIALESNLQHLLQRKKGFTDTTFKELGTDAFFYEIPERDLHQQIESVVLNAIHEDRVEALCFFTNRIAMAALGVLAKHDIKVPEDVGVVCFDHAEAYHIFKTSISFVQQPLAEMSRAAVKRILDPDTRSDRMYFNTTLVVNDSSRRRSKEKS